MGATLKGKAQIRKEVNISISELFPLEVFPVSLSRTKLPYLRRFVKIGTGQLNTLESVIIGTSNDYWPVQ